MKTFFIKLTCCAGLIFAPYYYAIGNEEDCDIIKNEQEKVKCQEEKIKEEMAKVENSAHLKWDNMDASQQDSAVHSTLKTRQIDSK